MRFDASQHMRLNQQMKLAPRMIQSMEILQMPFAALQERIEQELESNVALEEASPVVETQTTNDGPDEQPLDDQELVVGENTPDGAEDFERLSTLESSMPDSFENQYSSAQRPRSGEDRDRKMDAMANVQARSESLQEQLLQQWTFAEVTPEVGALGERLIGYLENDGLFHTSEADMLTDLAALPELKVTPELITEAIEALQHWLDPPGLAARTVKECLLIQVDSQDRNDPQHGFGWQDVRLLINSHFEDLLENRLPRISEESDLSMERIQAAIELMHRLKLSPGRELVSEQVPPIIPDIVVEYDEQADVYTARMSDGTLPNVQVSSDYEDMAKDKEVEKETRRFVTDSVRRASWLIDAINQRKHTMLRVVGVVLSRQRDFFDQGKQHLKPLPMIEVADQLNIHVGTVSRAVAEKWIATPRGVLPLRMFFSGGTETKSGEQMSWGAVKETLKEIVEEEDKQSPLSDEAIVKELKARGIDIARRTVVKYRQQLDIPPARRRRVFTDN